MMSEMRSEIPSDTMMGDGFVSLCRVMVTDMVVIELAGGEDS